MGDETSSRNPNFGGTRRMATARPQVNVYNAKSDAREVVSTTPLPGVFSAPIRRDLVQFVHKSMRSNSRQAYSVAEEAGHQTSAMSWGTGRAVARIPRVASSGTHRSGQGAFGNMCRGGRMFAPTKIWRRWHRHINVNERRYASASAVAATGLTALVLARGHRVEQLTEVPFVLDNVDDIRKTADAIEVLKRFGAFADVERAKETRKTRVGKGKARNRRYVERRGPLVIHASDKDAKAGRPLVELAFRNLPGVDVAHVDRLNLLQLAPGGHLGRFCIWTRGAFNRLNSLFGSAPGEQAELKKGFVLPRAAMTNADLARILNSTEVQSHLRAKKSGRVSFQRHGNPLRNKNLLAKLNPYSVHQRRQELLRKERKVAAKPVDKAVAAKRRSDSKAFYNAMLKDDWSFPSHNSKTA